MELFSFLQLKFRFSEYNKSKDKELLNTLFPYPKLPGFTRIQIPIISAYYKCYCLCMPLPEGFSLLGAPYPLPLKNRTGMISKFLRTIPEDIFRLEYSRPLKLLIDRVAKEANYRAKEKNIQDLDFPPPTANWSKDSPLWDGGKDWWKWADPKGEAVCLHQKNAHHQAKHTRESQSSLSHPRPSRELRRAQAVGVELRIPMARVDAWHSPPTVFKSSTK
ncbi:hypothetical protein T439DRAFT_350781 [Meredithblackwellia eburnea MCA 4105]